ncbi:hypothetical protein [Haloplanus halophilus]|uniref:hypothetical protein n=1 Tax=Haloplanus halophilus TaxID=2949993 RepID=UPI00203BBADB|nr:hypothetical protein [Haloplanus sp. GDY1]
MAEDVPEKPPAPELPKYLREPLENQSPERLEVVAAYAADLAEWKRRQREEELERRRAEDEVDEEELEELDEREISTDPEDYEDVPTNGAYITVKETKPGYRYYYFQWREGDTWKNEYIGPVNPKE